MVLVWQSGIDLGSLLIKRAAKAMATQNPSLERFITLSPIPGFRSWLDTGLQQWSDGSPRVVVDGSNILRLHPAEVNGLQLLYPAARDGHMALQQLLAEMFDGETGTQDTESAQDAQHRGDILASSFSSCSNTSYLRPVSTADGAALPCSDEDSEQSVSLNRRAARQHEMVALGRPLLLRLCGVYLLEARRSRRSYCLSTSPDSTTGTVRLIFSLLSKSFRA